MGVGVNQPWLKHESKETLTKNEVVLMWGIQIKTDTRILVNIPDIILHDTKEIYSI